MKPLDDELIAVCARAGFKAAPRLGKYVGRLPATDDFVRAVLEEYISHAAKVLTDKLLFQGGRAYVGVDLAKDEGFSAAILVTGDGPVPVCARCFSPDHHVSDCPEGLPEQ